MKINIYPIVDREFCQKNGKDILEWAQSIARSGAKFLQYRDKISADLEYRETAEALLVICRKFGVKLIVNDRVDVAVKMGADGVHLGQEDVKMLGTRYLVLGTRKGNKGEGQMPFLNRKKLKNFIIGISTHNLREAIEAAKWGADYVAIGPVFKTVTKPDARPIGLKEVEKVVNAIKIPVVAIGGINLKNVTGVLRIGVSYVAAVRAVDEFLANRECS